MKLNSDSLDDLTSKSPSDPRSTKLFAVGHALYQPSLWGKRLAQLVPGQMPVTLAACKGREVSLE